MKYTLSKTQKSIIFYVIHMLLGVAIAGGMVAYLLADIKNNISRTAAKIIMPVLLPAGFILLIGVIIHGVLSQPKLQENQHDKEPPDNDFDMLSDCNFENQTIINENASNGSPPNSSVHESNNKNTEAWVLAPEKGHKIYDSMSDSLQSPKNSQLI